jgi:hypothetical protein
LETDFAEDSSFGSQSFLIRENCIKHAIKFSRESFPERFFHGATSLQNALNFFSDSAFRTENFPAEISLLKFESTNETNDRTIFIRAAIFGAVDFDFNAAGIWYGRIVRKQKL